MNVTDLPDRIASKIRVAASGCWEWTGSRNQHGYGTVRPLTREFGNRTTLKAHRYVWIQFHGSIPDGLWVLHRCDNPPCCNPDHLWLGTPADNTADRDAKGRARYVRGTDNGAARLTDQQVREIRIRRQADEQFQSIARDMGVSRKTVRLVVNGETWSHVA